MQRRHFIKSATVAASCSMAAMAVANPAALRMAPDLHSYKCKITVLRKDFNEDFFIKYPYGHATACDRLEVGQEFIVDSVWDPPAGMCTWAWSDLRFIIHGICAGNPGPMVSCCTDGLRPVFFKFERVDAV